MKFFIENYFDKCEFPVDLVTFTEEIFNGKLHFLCSDALIAGIVKFKITFIHFINPFLVKHPNIFGFLVFSRGKKWKH